LFFIFSFFFFFFTTFFTTSSSSGTCTSITTPLDKLEQWLPARNVAWEKRNSRPGNKKEIRARENLGSDVSGMADLFEVNWGSFLCGHSHSWSNNATPAADMSVAVGTSIDSHVSKVFQVGSFHLFPIFIFFFFPICSPAALRG
jgi:hypothetical protein